MANDDNSTIRSHSTTPASLPPSIERFVGPYRWLSNFAWCRVVYDGVRYPSIEHAYQAQKTLDLVARQKFRSPHVTPGQAKKLGRTLDLRPDWLEVRVGVMKELLRAKFKDDPFRMLLLLTGEARLVEGNAWGDTFWGVDDEKGGENMLGKLLMEVRDELRRAD